MMETHPESPPESVPTGPWAEGVAAIKAHLRTLTDSPGVYRMINAAGEVLYVGKAKRLNRRVVAYTRPEALPVRLQRMISQTRKMEFVVTTTEAEALLLECSLIKTLMPRYNILLRDHKAFPYIALTRHRFARILKHRGARHEKEADYFGPFASAGDVTSTLNVLARAFQLRNCSDTFFANRTRPCLQYHIKRCTGPCVGRVTEADYQEQARQARAFLTGKSSLVQQELAGLMQQAAEERHYEKAAALRDRIRALTSIQQRQSVQAEGVGDADVIGLASLAGQTCVQVFFFRQGQNYGTRSYFPSHEKDTSSGDVLAAFIGQFYAGHVVPPLLLLSEEPTESGLLAEALKTHLQVPQRGDKAGLVAHVVTNARHAMERHLAEKTSQARLLEGVATLFGLPVRPQRIEIYDNSHLQGSHPLGAMVVAGPEGFLKNQYRTFNIKDKDAAGDDFAMMREVMRRRFARREVLPDLVLIDGGAGQLSAVAHILSEAGLPDIPLVGIAKGPDRNAGREWFYRQGQAPFQLPPDDAVLFYLQRLRDEAHRFVITGHRARRGKKLTTNPLDALPGIGPSRRRALLHHFGSARAAREASLADLEQTPGISKALAAKIFAFFRE